LLNIIAGLKKNDMSPVDLMVNHVPVIPPKFRPFSITGNTFLPGDANEMYKDLIEYRRLYERTAKEFGHEGAGEVYADMNNAAKAVYGYGESPNPKTRARAVKGFFDTVTGTNPKTSMYQSKMLSKPVDTVGRGVIIPDADLGMDEVGIPEEMAWKLYGSYIQRNLVRGGMSPGGALKHVKDRSPQALKALEREMPDRPVVITRSPAWHKYNVIGQNPHIVKGDAIQVNTFTMEGVGGDFDGDCQFAHIQLLRRKNKLQNSFFTQGCTSLV
jgi:DNA-directed RNA polymerase beta' subunit